MPVIKSIACRRVLNSHVEFTHEFLVHLVDGTTGAAASPEGETVSIYEKGGRTKPPEAIARDLRDEGCLEREIDQADFDAALERNVKEFGRQNTYGLSLAFFNAVNASGSISELRGVPPSPLSPPRLCLNILNGGGHAYTNPVLSDFPEYLLVARSTQVDEVIRCHADLQRVVREGLRRLPVSEVSGNPVHRFSTNENRECIDFVLGVRDRLGLAKHFDLMIDASAGDLWSGSEYRFEITDQSSYSREELTAYWLSLLREYQIRFLEDPFEENDVTSWQALTASQSGCSVIGDNLYCSDAARIKKGSAERWTHGVILKPNQAGTVTSIRQAIAAAQENHQIAITSHRSISTEETFLARLTCAHQIQYIKIGPLFSDYSSVVRLNAILRLVEHPSNV